MREFEDLPALRVTVPQAMRLWCLDRATCQIALDTLVKSNLLEKDRTGRYARSPAFATASAFAEASADKSAGKTEGNTSCAQRR
jgi:hypothetical protein